jgi:hypothetical protein
VALSPYRRPSIADVRSAEYWAYLDAGVFGDKVELLDGVVYLGDWPLALSPAQARIARTLAPLAMPTFVDVILEDEEALEELLRRLAARRRPD